MTAAQVKRACYDLKLRFIQMNDTTLRVHLARSSGNRNVDTSYDSCSDLYNVTAYQFGPKCPADPCGMEYTTEEAFGVYADSLRSCITGGRS